MLYGDQIKKEISESEFGSDLHGLVSKIAFFIHLKDKRVPREENWHNAVDKVVRWTDHSNRSGLRDVDQFEFAITDLLKHYAHQRYDSRDMRDDKKTAFDDWVYAQDTLAFQVLAQGRMIAWFY